MVQNIGQAAAPSAPPPPPFRSSSPAMATIVLLPASSKVNLLNDDTYRLDSATVIMSSFGQIEQGVH